jgi:hypothetical protein
MKRFYFIFLVLLISGGGGAQVLLDMQPLRKITPPTFYKRSAYQLYDSIYYWKWDNLNTGWQFNERIIDIVYDANYNILNETRQKWEGESWINYRKFLNSYDASNNLINSLSEYWASGSWMLFQQVTYTYDENQNLKSWLIAEGYHSGGGCVYNYDDHDNLITQIYQAGGHNTSQYVYTYDASNKMTTYLYQSWIENNWWNEFSGTYEYDENNNKTGALFYRWNGTSWEIIGKSSFTYDANNNLIGQSGQDWVDSVWMNNYQFNYSYDSSSFRMSEVYKIWDPVGTWMNVDSTHFYYQTVLGTVDLRALSDKIKAYPNPSSTTITIELPQIISTKYTFLTIYNSTGQILIEKQITEPVIMFDVSALPRGICFLRLTSEARTQVLKILLVN